MIIEILRGRTAISEALAKLERSSVPVYCTAISWAEVFSGVRPGEESATEAFFNARGDVVIDAGTGRQAGTYLARFRRSHGIEISDALIAAVANTTGLKLWTLNKRHYPMTDLSFFEP